MKRIIGKASLLLVAVATVAATYVPVVSAAQPAPGPVDSSVGVEGRITSPPPTQAATIVSPARGQSFSSIPVDVTGSCPANTLVKIFDNNIFVGSAACGSGSYSLQISLFSGQNDLVARVFDALDQQGPDSATTTITYNDPQFGQFGTQVILTSQYARRAADPNTVLEWPLIISDGIGPYALSADWGDGTSAQLSSQPFAGVVNMQHTYKDSGLYRVIFKVADKNGSSAFLQVVAVSSGATGGAATNRTVSNSDQNQTVVTKTKVLWQPAAGLVAFTFASFWLGRRYELSALRKRIEREYR